MLKFEGLSHRLENLGKYNGVQFINDSKATSIESVIEAVDSLDGISVAGNKFILLGGRDKNLPWNKLKILTKKEKVKFIFFGEAADKIKSGSGLPGEVYADLKTALNGIADKLKDGDVCLLSPGGTSLDEFKNFEERG
ncbi:MAG: cyanophycin synthetase, partial [Bdellovibrionota bacterium]